MEKEFIKWMPTVYSENGMQFVMLPDGKKIPDIVKTTVIDDCNDTCATVIIELKCNICSTKEEALKLYKISNELFRIDSNGNLK